MHIRVNFGGPTVPPRPVGGAYGYGPVPPPHHHHHHHHPPGPYAYGPRY